MTAERIFGCSHEFVARDRELGEIIAAAHSGRDLALLAAPGAGASELLRQAYDELFHSDAVTPFYFELKASDGDARSAALRFASEFITQTVAFSRKDPHILWSRPTLNELSLCVSRRCVVGRWSYRCDRKWKCGVAGRDSRACELGRVRFDRQPRPLTSYPRRRTLY